LTRLVTWPVHHPRAALLVALLAAALSLAAVSRIRPDASLERMFPRNDPSAKALGAILNRFSAVDDLLVLASLPDSDAADPPDVQRLLSFAQRLESQVRDSAEAQRLTDGVVYQADEQTLAFFEKVLVPNALFYLDDQAFAGAQQRLSRPGMAEQVRRNQTMISAPGPAANALSKAILQDPLHLHEFILDKITANRPMRTYQNSQAFLSPDGRSLLIRVIGKRPPSDLEFSKHFTAVIASLVDRANSDGLTIDISGSYAIAAASERAIRRDMISSVIGSVVSLALLFLAAYRRSFVMFALAFGPTALGALYGFGVHSLISPSLTPITAVVGGILAGMGIDYSIQYLAHFQAQRSNGQSAADAARHALVVVGPALFAAWATSVVGFIAIGWSSVQALRDFALLASLGLAGAYLASIFVLPALVMAADRWKMTASSSANANRLRIEPLLGFLSRRPGWAAGVCGVIALAAILVSAAPGDLLPLESDLTVMHPRPNPPLDAQTRIARRMGISPGSFLIYLHSDTPENLVALAHEVSRRLGSPGVRAAGVSGTFGLASLLPDPAVARSRLRLIGPAEADRIVSDFRAVIADSLFSPAAYEPYASFLRHLLTRTTPPGLPDLISYRRLAESFVPSSAFSANVVPTEAISLVNVDRPPEDRVSRDAAISAIRQALAGLDGATLTGMSVMSYDIERSVHHDLPRLLAAAMGVVAAYLLVHFRSLKDAALAILPALFSFACLLAILRLSGQRLNVINLISLPLLVGIDVDYGIFLVSLARVVGRNLSRGDLSRELAPSCHAILMCALATILGFGSLAFTSVPAIASLGVAVGVGVAGAFAGTVFLLFPVLVLIARRRQAALPEAPR
jgi:predicted RND superfamily exporter protein